MNDEARTVSRKHAELALSEALRRMTAAIYQASNHNPDEPDQADVMEMVLEAAGRAVNVALELETILGLGRVDDELNARECYQQWCDWLHIRGARLDVEEEEAAA